MYLKNLFFALIIISITKSPTFKKSHLYCQGITEFLKSQTNIVESSQIEKESLLKGEEYFFKKSFTVAEIFFKKVIEINPENSIAHSYLGEINLYFKKVDEAIYHFQIAIELLKNQKNHLPEKEYFRLAQAYYVKKDIEKAKTYCELILEKNQSFYPCYYYLGMIAIEYEKNRELALKNFQKYWELLHVTPLSNIPEFEENREKIKQLIEFLSNSNNQANQLQDTSRTLQQQLDPLNLFYKNQNLTKPLSFLKPKEREEFHFLLPPEKKFDEKWIEIQHVRKHNTEKAIEVLYEYKTSSEIKSAKENYLIRKSLCSIFLEQKNYSEAEKECKEAILFDFDSELLYYLSMIYYKKKDKESFEKYIKKYLDTEKYDLNTYFMLAHYYYEEKRYNEALEYFEKILSLKSNHKESLYYLYEIYKELNKPNKMIEILEKIEIYYPEEFELQRILVFELLEKGEEDIAIRFLDRIYKNTKEKYDGLILAGLYLKKENKEKTKETLIELYQLYPEELEIVKAIILFFKEEQTNYDTLEIVAKKFLQKATLEQKQEILKILPESLKKQFDALEQKNSNF